MWSSQRGRARTARAVFLAFVLAWSGGCRSVARHRADADRAAERVLTATQKRALGEAESVEVESAAETLRRRLLLDQQLPHRGPASLGVRDLPDSEYWDASKHLKPAQPLALPPWLTVTNGPLTLTLLQALQVGARNGRSYQAAKEALFTAALDLDLESNEFRNTFSGLMSGTVESDGSGEESADSGRGTAEAGLTRTFLNGLAFSGRVAVDLVQLLTHDVASSLGLFADASVSIPLLRGAGRRIAAEGLKQAEQDVLYEVYTFERFKRTFAVRVASDYLAVLQKKQQVRNAEENYKRLMAGTRRARRLSDSGRLPEFEFDQVVQDELRARTRWIAARQDYASALDKYKVLLGLPPDAAIELDPTELDRLRVVADRFAGGAGSGATAERVAPGDEASIRMRPPGAGEGGPMELDPGPAMQLALDSRLDLRIAEGKVADAQRRVYVAADALRGEVSLLGRAQAGSRRTSAASATEGNATLNLADGSYSALLNIDLPLERTAERNAYRAGLLALQDAVRNLQDKEDEIKLSIRETLRELLRAREAVLTQLEAMTLAEKRVRSTDMFLQAGRAQIRDVLDSQEALLNAQNALTGGVVTYRVAELALQRDLGVLQVSADGLWQEYEPEDQSE